MRSFLSWNFCMCVGLLALSGCEQRQPTRAEIVEELKRQGHNVVDPVPFASANLAEEVLVEELRKILPKDGTARFRRIKYHEEPGRLYLVVFALKHDREEVVDAVEKVLRNSEVEAISLVKEYFVGEGEEKELVFEAREFRIVDGEFEVEELGRIESGMIGKDYE